MSEDTQVVLERAGIALPGGTGDLPQGDPLDSPLREEIARRVDQLLPGVRSPVLHCGASSDRSQVSKSSALVNKTYA